MWRIDMFNTQQIKKDFPIFTKNPDLVYLDSAATSLKPQLVIDKLNEYYTQYSSNIHRGIYDIAEKATAEYEIARQKVDGFIHASPEEVIFTSGTTDSINLLASSLAETVEAGDEICVTIADHHSNFVPWQQLAFKNGATFRALPVEDVILSVAKNLGVKTKILALPLISNTLGTIFPIKEIARKAKEINPDIYIIVDAAQSVPHRALDVRDLGADFVAFSGHKMVGPTGIGVLWGRRDILDRMPPYKFGGEMIESVSVEKTTFNSLPHKFEAGTPPIAQAIGLGAAVDYLQNVGIDKIEEHEKALTSFARQELKREFGEKITIYGPAGNEDRGGLLSFTFGNYHAHDIAQILSEEHIAVRAGNHCTMPLHTALGVAATVRASFYMYNDESDVNKL
ncbi:MAG: cysteine desulfurase, partial [Microgenomates group bacterium]